MKNYYQVCFVLDVFVHDIINRWLQSMNAMIDHVLILHLGKATRAPTAMNQRHCKHLASNPKLFLQKDTGVMCDCLALIAFEHGTTRENVTQNLREKFSEWPSLVDGWLTQEGHFEWLTWIEAPLLKDSKSILPYGIATNPEMCAWCFKLFIYVFHFQYLQVCFDLLHYLFCFMWAKMIKRNSWRSYSAFDMSCNSLKQIKTICP